MVGFGSTVGNFRPIVGSSSSLSGSYSNGWAPITSQVQQAPWKTPEQLVAQPSSSGPLHQPIHGRTIPIFRGAYKRQGDLFWADPVENKSFSRTGGKGGGGGGGSTTTSTSSTSETGYVASFAIGLGRNEFQKALTLLKVMADETVIYDATSGNATFSGMTMRAYDGVGNAVDPYMLARDGADKTPAYNGYAYLFFENFRVEDFGYRIPIITAEVTDDADAVTNESSFPMLTRPSGYGSFDPYHLAYDQVLNRFYLAQNSDSTTDYLISTIDFDSQAEVSLVELSGFPGGSITTLNNATAIPGTGLILAQGYSGSGSRYDLLIEADSGVVVDTYEWTTAEEVLWSFAQSLSGSSSSKYIVVGIATEIFTGGRFVVGLVDKTNSTISIIAHGTSAITTGTGVVVTPGISDSGTAVFYVAGRTTAIFEGVATDSTEPTYSSVYSIPSGDEVYGIYYDAGFDAIIASVKNGSSWTLRSIDPSDGSVNWNVAVTGGGTDGYVVRPGGGSWFASQDSFSLNLTHRLRSGYAVLKWENGATNPELLVNLKDGTTTEIGRAATWFDMDHFDQYTGNAWEFDVTDWLTNSSQRFSAGDIPIAEVLTDFSVYAGYTLSQITTVGLDGLHCKGLFIERDATIQDLARQVCELYGIDIVESGDQIKFVRKGTDASYAADVTIAATELIAVEVDDATTHVSSSRQYEDDVPAELEVQYIDVDADFQVQQQIAQRPNAVFEVTLSTRKETISVPLVLNGWNAKLRITERLYSWVSGQNSHRIILPPEHLGIEPSDILEVTADGVTRTVKVTRATFRPDYSQELEIIEYLTEAAVTVVATNGNGTTVEVDSSGTFTSGSPDETVTTTITAGHTTDPNAKTLNPQPSRYFHMDLPLLRFQHDTSGASLVQYHVITGRGQTTWDGGSVWRSQNGSDWENVHTLGGVYPTVAVCTTALGAPAVDWSTDYDNTVTLRVIAGSSSDIDSSTYAEVMEGANNAAIGRPGRWEIIQWITATANADGTITLSGIVRGHRGTEAYGSTHEVGDYFVVLRSDYQKELFYDTGDLNGTYFYKAVGRNQDLGDVATDVHTITGAAETPYAPCNLDADLSGSDIALSWTRRTRLSAPWKDDGSATEAPLGETSRLYDIEIIDSISGGSPDQIVLRTISNVTTESYTYPEADILSDFGSIPDVLTFRVYQRSEIIGRGHVREASIEVV